MKNKFLRKFPWCREIRRIFVTHVLRAISLRDFDPWGRENLQGLKWKRVLASALQIARPSFGLNKW